MEDKLAKLEEYISDYGKIVTVASYAVSADIPFDESKKIIDKYLEMNQNSKEIHVTYILNGIKRDTGKFTVVQVSDEALEYEKQQYKVDPATVVFSIQKAKQIDYNVISLVESSLDFKTKTLSGAIVGKNCIKRLLRKNILPPLPVSTIKGKSTIFSKQNVKSEIKSEEANKAVENNEPNHENKKAKVVPRGSIANMFNKAGQTKKTESKPEKSAEQQKQNGGLTSYFTKQPKGKLPKELEENNIKKEKEVDPNIEEKVDEHSSNSKIDSGKNTNEKNKNRKSDLFDSDTDEEILNDINMQESSAAKIAKDKKTEVKSSQKKIRTSQKKKREKADIGNNKSVKKRKRIIVDEDSDSDDIFGSEKSGNEEDTAEKYDEEIAEIESGPLPPKNKIRKAIKKTYEDEEGFIVTQTEFVYETASEDENEPNNKMVKKEEPPKPKVEKKSSNTSEPEISPLKPTKTSKGSKKAPPSNQPTLMNFFKKK